MVTTSRGQSRPALSFLDFISLVVGAIIGADIYVVAGIGASLMGPALLVVWVVAGIVASFIVLCFAQCAAIEPAAGGPYAYARSALGTVPALLVGWALYLAEWAALAVFPVAAARYVSEAFGLDPTEVVVFKAAFVAIFTASNFVGIRVAGIVNDVLTASKLVPLVAFVLVVALYAAQQPSTIGDHLVPFAPLGWGSFGSAFVLVFWAYAGFEVSSLPASAVSHPRSTMPRGIILGMLISIVFYLLTNLAVFVALPWPVIGQSRAPLALAMATALSSFGIAAPVGFGLMTAGAILSISGVDQATTLGTAELAGALAEDQILPSIFGHRSSRFGTCDFALLFQGATALVASLLLNLVDLIQIAVFFLVLVYAVTAVASKVLLDRHPNLALRIPGMSVIPILAAIASLAVGASVPIVYVAFGFGLLCVAALITLLERRLKARVR